MKVRIQSIASITVILAAVGCGGGMSPEDASRAFAAMSTVASSAQQQAMSNPNALGATGTFVIDSSVNCPTSGTASFTGSLTMDSATQYNFDFTFVYSACATSDVEMNGNMSMTGAGAVDTSVSPPSVTMTFTYNGSLEFSGTVSGSCDFDLTGTADAGGNISMTGTICGMDVSEIT